MMRLELNDVHTYYGSSHILFGIGLAVTEGQVVCLLGRNGAGKTTTMRTIMGLAQATDGAIIYNDCNLIGMEPYQIAHLGVGFVPDDRLIFPDLTVRENLRLPRATDPARRNSIGTWRKSTICFPCSSRSIAGLAPISAAASSRC